MTNDVMIRRATDFDIANIKARFSNEPDKSIGYVTVGSETLGETVFVIEFGAEVAGFVTLRTLTDEVFPIFIFSPYRRKGIGAEAMKQLVELWKAEGGQEIFLDIMDGAEKFWGHVFAGYPVRHVTDRKFSVDIS
ncbi:GNAT family N-acetyltransferase [Pseudomonas alabamensis]|uniref:GNAT family N-acetyltransferase n=1 Tax=Pseudomonas alabamensis TaxID=3064349 RepID=UPI003F64B745